MQSGPSLLNIRMIWALGTLLTLATPAWSQRGDRPGETQPSLPDQLHIPAALPQSPAQALSTFRVHEGLRIELVAAEPLVHAPVCMDLDPAGQLWVVEMSGYMTDPEGSKELEPLGRIVTLTDENSDGIMDRRQVFLEGLVLPRGVAVVDDGVLVIAPPHLIYATDEDGDGRADHTQVLDDTFAGLDNPEHAGNGLRRGFDGWLHMSQHPWEYRWRDGQLNRRRVPNHGQWGTTSDAWGRWYVNTNSYPLITDLIPKHIASHNPAQQDRKGISIPVPADQAVHSIRVNPGVNRGYAPETLRDDFHLKNYTAACSPEVYDADQLGNAFRGDVFICEPAGNTVEHLNMIAGAGTPGEARVDPTVGAIVASTDERFRPVALLTGSDGALYIADFYRGILQHKVYMTSFLRQQVIDRGLDAPIDAGRIWRIVPDDTTSRSLPNLTNDTTEALITRLHDDNATIRRLAQQLLVAQADQNSIAPLHDLAGNANSFPLARAHALWTLHLMDALEVDLLRRTLIDDFQPLRIQAMRIAADYAHEKRIRDMLSSAMLHKTPEVRREAAAALVQQCPKVIDDIATALATYPSDDVLRTAAVSGLSGYEVELLDALLWTSPPLNNKSYSMVRSIARTAARSSADGSTLHLMELLAAIPADQNALATQIAMGMTDAYALKQATPRQIHLSQEPFDWTQRLQDEPDLAGGLLRLIDAHTTWPTRPGYTPQLDVATYSPKVRAQMQKGAELYASCAGCHQQDGRGVRSFYPPLAQSPIVNGPAEPLLSVLLHGLEGPIERNGTQYNFPMPPAPVVSDEDVAALATYIRLSWNNTGLPISAADVTRVRTATKGQNGPWSIQSLHERWE